MAGKSHGHATQGSCVVVGEDSYHTYKYVFQSQRGAPVSRLLKSEYAGYDPVKDEETYDDEEDDLLRSKLPIKNEDDDVNIKDDDDDTDDECCRGKLVYQR